MGERVAAAVVRAPGEPPRLAEITLLPVGAGQVRVRLAAAGVCHTDLSLAGGTLRHPVPLVLGHEGAGEVVEVGPEVRDLREGDHVVLNWAPACGDCWYCGHGEPYLCENAARGQLRAYATLDDGTEVYRGLGVGAFAGQTVVDERACIPVPPDIPLAEAALLGCAVLTGVGAVLNSARVTPGDSVVVIGLGGVGLCAVQGARLAGAGAVVAVDPAPAKADLARRLGATDVLVPGPKLPRQVRELTGGRGADHAIECVGRATTIRTAWSVTRRGGRTTVVGMGPITEEVAFNALEIALTARTLTGCMYGSTDPLVDVPMLLDHYRAGRLDLGALVTRTGTLDDVGSAFDDLAAGAGARTLLIP